MTTRMFQYLYSYLFTPLPSIRSSKRFAARSIISCFKSPEETPNYISSPVSVPVLVPNVSTSMPSLWSILTYRLHNGDQSRRVGLYREMTEIEEQSRAADKIGGVGDVFGGLDIQLGLWFFGPTFVNDHALLKRADAGEVFIELVAVFATGVRAQRLGLNTDVIENAAPVFETANLFLHIFGIAFEEQAGEDLRR